MPVPSLMSRLGRRGALCGQEPVGMGTVWGRAGRDRRRRLGGGGAGPFSVAQVGGGGGPRRAGAGGGGDGGGKGKQGQAPDAGGVAERPWGL